MENSTSTLLYTATYVIIFVIAISLSVILYLNVNKYADSAFNYSSSINSSIINSETSDIKTDEYKRKYLTQDEVFSYYVNYIKKDLYDTSSSNNQDIEYVVSIIDPQTNASILDGGLLYSKVKEKLQLCENYYLDYKEENINNQKKRVVINIGPVREGEK